MKKQKMNLSLNKKKISNLSSGQVMGGATIGDAGCGAGTTGCGSKKIYCTPTGPDCPTPISEAPTCTLQTIDLSFCGSGTVPVTCESNQVCA